MSELYCQTCGSTWDWDVGWDDVPQGEEIFSHERNSFEESGIRTSYYCSADCIVKGVIEQEASA